MIKFIEDNLKRLVNDSYGVHVIEKMIICYDEELLKNTYKIILENFLLYANDSNTLCIVS